MERLIAGAVIGLGLMFSPCWIGSAQAEGLACEHRSAAHIAEHGGRLADDAWHVSHGQLPSCDDAKASSDQDKHSDNQDDNEKSRYCRRHFFC